MLKMNIAPAMRGQILAAISGETFYIPKNGGSVNTSSEFKELVKGKQKPTTLLEVGTLLKQGRTNSNNIATGDDVFRAVCKVKCGDLETEIRLHLVDIVTLLLADNNTAVISYGTYYPEKEDKTTFYLVPACAERVNAEKVKDYIESMITELEPKQ